MTGRPEDPGGEGGSPDRRPETRTARSRRTSEERARLNRRRFLGWTAGGVAAAAVGLGVSESLSGGSDQAGDTHTTQTTATSKKEAAERRAARKAAREEAPRIATFDGVRVPVAPAVVAENAKTGDAWWVTTPQADRDIEGYADQVSAEVGDTVTLYVNTVAPRFHVEAYRMGYYQGIGGRLVWTSAEVSGVRQPQPTLAAATNTIECRWSPSLTVAIDDAWPPGAYLLKLVGDGGQQQFIPLCVRDDSSRAAVVIQHSVTTWQAYNRWGGYSLYYGNAGGALSFTHDPAGGSFEDRARIVSFDRPYDHNWASGAADFVGNELPAIYQAEKMGLDVTYWTDVDLHVRPQLLVNHRALISLGHDEYWSAPMRDGVARALAGGVNLAFLGANACYRQIRFEPSAVGPNRLQVCYKSADEDPLATVNPSLTTVNWPDPPVSRPESTLIGSTYQDIGAHADMVITDPTSWVFDGLGLKAGRALPDAVLGEFDRYVPGGDGPTNLDVIAHSVVANRGGNYSDVTWYTVPGGGGVFATGNASWVGQLADSTLIPPNVLPNAVPGVTPTLLRAMLNVYSVIGLGPASLTRPSQGNWRTVYAAGTPSSAAPNTINAA
jgi:hypothetical protein